MAAFALAACGQPAPGTDAGSPDGAAPPGDGGSMVLGPIHGTATYEDLQPTTSGLPVTGPSAPIRRARVRVLDATGAMLGESTTDETGAFSVDVGTSPLVGASLEVAAAMHTSTVEAYVADHADTQHALRVAIASAATDVHASAAASANRIAGPFNILDRLVRLEDFLLADAPAGTVMPRVVVRWEVGSTDGTNAHGAQPTAFGDACIVRLLGQPDIDDDAFDDTVISHEIGHCVAFTFSSYAAPRWHDHTAFLPVEPGLALNEGVATYLGQRMSGSSIYLDTHGPSDALSYDIDTPGVAGCELSMYGEAAISGVLWDLTDGGAGDDDSLTLTAAQFWSLLHEDVRDGVYKSVHTYLDGVVTRGLASDAQLQTAFGTQLGIHRPASPTFPIAMLVPGTTVSDSVDATLGGMTSARPRAESIDDWGFEVTTSGRYRIDLTNTAHVDDLDLYVETTERDDVVHSDATGTSDESVDMTLAPGRYVVLVRAFSGPDTSAAYSLLVTAL